jgi:hypothetical protein
MELGRNYTCIIPPSMEHGRVLQELGVGSKGIKAGRPYYIKKPCIVLLPFSAINYDIKQQSLVSFCAIIVADSSEWIS